MEEDHQRLLASATWIDWPPDAARARNWIREPASWTCRLPCLAESGDEGDGVAGRRDDEVKRGRRVPLSAHHSAKIRRFRRRLALTDGDREEWKVTR